MSLTGRGRNVCSQSRTGRVCFSRCLFFLAAFSARFIFLTAPSSSARSKRCLTNCFIRGHQLRHRRRRPRRSTCLIAATNGGHVSREILQSRPIAGRNRPAQTLDLRSLIRLRVWQHQAQPVAHRQQGSRRHRIRPRDRALFDLARLHHPPGLLLKLPLIGRKRR